MPRASRDDSRRGAKWQARRQAIVDTSARVIARRGYAATGIMDLCAANDLGKGALYHYIGSKEELLAAIHDRVMDEVMIGAERVADAGGSPPQQLAMLGDVQYFRQARVFVAAQCRVDHVIGDDACLLGVVTDLGEGLL
jgi:AcrR family transcriptional regulator